MKVQETPVPLDLAAPVIPAQTGIQPRRIALDSRLRGNDGRLRGLTDYSAVVFAVMLIAGCVAVPPPNAPTNGVAPQWHASLPHDGSAAKLQQWWAQFDDPLIAQLIEQSQRDNPTLAQAAARIAQARAAVRSAGGGYWPTVDENARGARSRTEIPAPKVISTTSSIGLDALWEIDLFGVTRNTVSAARARADGSALQWHDARVSLAAEVARNYVGLRACEALVAVNEQDAASQKTTAELTQLKVKAGFEAPASSALAQASAADASNRLVAQRAECDVIVKSVVALTGIDESKLRVMLGGNIAKLPQPAAFAVTALPAHVLQQRPDLIAAERDIAAASSDIGAAQANRYPRVSLSGSIALATARIGGVNSDGVNASIGPSISLPIFDAGRRAAAVDAARGRYDEAVAVYRQRTRAAIREVEEALVRLDAATRREADAQRAASGFAEYFTAAQARWNAGSGSLLDLEDARRIALSASSSLIQVRRERVDAWVALYKAVGGGWDAAADYTATETNLKTEVSK